MNELDPANQYPANPYAAPQAEEAKDFSATPTDGLSLNPWTSIWLRPRATIRQIVDTDPTYKVILVVLLAGMANGLSNLVGDDAAAQAAAATGPAAFVIGAIIGAGIVGGLFGLVAWLIGSWLVKVTASWLGGKATLKEMRAAYAWGQAPSIYTLIPALLILVISRGNVDAAVEGNLAVAAVIGLAGISMAVIGIWSFVTLCRCVGEVSHFSGWRGLGALILAILLLAIPMILLVIGILSITQAAI